MKIKILAQALKFACLPTLSVLLLLFFGFFSISKTIDFIASDNGFAIALRVIVVILEIVLVYFMYMHYAKIEVLKNGTNNLEDKYSYEISRNDYVKSLFKSDNYSDEFYVYESEYPNIKIIERKPKTS